MGFDIRDIESSKVDLLADHIRNRGFEVLIEVKRNKAPIGGTLTQLICRRGKDEQIVTWASVDITPGTRRLAIRSQRGWLWVPRRRIQLQTEITKAIEDFGGICPYPT